MGLSNCIGKQIGKLLRDDSSQSLPNETLQSSTNTPPTLKKKSWREIQEEFKKGKRLAMGDRIEHIYCIDPDFVIYRTENSIRTYINEDHLEGLNNKPLTQRRNKIQEDLAEVTSIQPDRKEDTKTINPLIAKGIILALDDKTDEAKKILEIAKKRLKKFNEDYRIFRYLKGSFFMSIRFMLVIILLKIMPTLLPDLFNNTFDLFKIPEEFFVVIFFGALGGFLSVAYGIRRGAHDIDLDFGSNIERLAASRIYIAVISSLIIYSALRGEIVSGLSISLSENSNICTIPTLRIAFISAIAGFVERLVPDLLTNKANKDGTPPEDDTGDQSREGE